MSGGEVGQRSPNPLELTVSAGQERMQNLLAAFPSILPRLGRRRIDEIVAKVAEQRNEAIEQASVDQQRVAGFRPGVRRAETEVSPGGLVDVVDVLEAGEVTSAGPRIEGLIARIFIWGHQRHRLDDVLPDEFVRTLRCNMRARIFERIELVANREKLASGCFGILHSISDVLGGRR